MNDNINTQKLLRKAVNSIYLMAFIGFYIMSLGLFSGMPFGFDVLMFFSSFLVSSVLLLFILIPLEIIVSNIKSMTKQRHIEIANKLIGFEVYFPLIWLPLALVMSYFLAGEG